MDLFTVQELANYAQRDLRGSTARLVKELTEDAILGLDGVGARITDPPQKGIKGIALEVARRGLLNPANVQAEAANGTSVTYATGGGSRGVSLQDREIAQLRAIVGDSSAYTVDLGDPYGPLIWPGRYSVDDGWVQ